MFILIISQDISREIRDLKSKVQTFMDEKDSMMADHQDFTKQKAKLELQIKDLQDEEDGNVGTKVGQTSWSDE